MNLSYNIHGVVTCAMWGERYSYLCYKETRRYFRYDKSQEVDQGQGMSLNCN